MSVITLGWYLLRRPEGFWLVPVLVLLALGALAGWPRAITLDDQGITQRDLLGRTKRIRWQHLDGFGHLSTEGTTILSGDGVQIVHTQFHANKAQFCQSVRERAHRNVLVSKL